MRLKNGLEIFKTFVPIPIPIRKLKLEATMYSIVTVFIKRAGIFQCRLKNFIGF